MSTITPEPATIASMRLSDFCWMPYSDQRNDYLDDVREAAIKEEWGQDDSYLRTYIADTFEIAYKQGLVYEHPERLFCLWRVGHLVTREGEPLTILGTKNRLSGKQPYVYTKVFDRRRFTVRTDDGDFQQAAPKDCQHQIPPYKTDYRLVYNFQHYLDDHEDRAVEKLPNLTPHQRFLCIYAALELAHKRGAQSAVPQWYRDKNAESGTYQWLLPLHIKSENISEKPDLVAVLHAMDEYQEYNVPTLLPPEWAYGHARAVSGRDPYFRSWA